MEAAQHRLGEDLGTDTASDTEPDLPWLEELYPSSFFDYSSDSNMITNNHGPQCSKETMTSGDEDSSGDGDDNSTHHDPNDPSNPGSPQLSLEDRFPAYLFDYSDPNWDINNVRYKKGKGPVDWCRTGRVYNIPPSYNFWPPRSRVKAQNSESRGSNVVPGLSYVLDEKDPNWVHNADRYLSGMGPEDIHKTGRKYEIPADYLFWKCPKNVTLGKLGVLFTTHFPIDWTADVL